MAPVVEPRRDPSGRPAARRSDGQDLARIAAAAELVAVGHRALRDALQPGVSEVGLWATARAALERASDGPVEAHVDLMAGQRTALVDEAPSAARVRPGDPVLFDLAPRRDGAWADSCATVACGEPGEALVLRHGAVRRALEAGLSAARPGAEAGSVDAAIRAELEAAGLDCPHHTGHGVGARPQQDPWIVPGGEAVLERGMVIALEPGAYADGFGVRLEHLAVVEADGARTLTEHSLSLT